MFRSIAQCQNIWLKNVLFMVVSMIQLAEIGNAAAVLLVIVMVQYLTWSEF